MRHGFHIEQSRMAEADFSRNSIPGLIDCKSDYSENGSLDKKEQLQSEYWTIIYYTLLISIASFLVASVWRERASVLPIEAEVTVEPADYEPPAGVVALSVLAPHYPLAIARALCNSRASLANPGRPLVPPHPSHCCGVPCSCLAQTAPLRRWRAPSGRECAGRSLVSTGREKMKSTTLIARTGQSFLRCIIELPLVS